MSNITIYFMTQTFVTRSIRHSVWATRG